MPAAQQGSAPACSIPLCGIALVLAAVVTSSVASGCFSSSAPANSSGSYGDVNAAMAGDANVGTPLVISRASESQLPAAVVDRLRASLYSGGDDQQEVDPSFPVFTHLLLLDGKRATVRHRGESISVLDVFTDSRLLERCFGKSSLVRTRQGVAFVSKDFGGEYHRDQVLATLAQCDVALDWPVVVDGHRFAVRDLLNDSLANFRLQQDELPWTAIAYARYVDPGRSWTNKFGAKFDCDDLATALRESHLSRASCGGLHHIQALTQLLSGHRRSRLLSAPVATATQHHLERCLAAAVNQQFPDGSWNPSWVHEIQPGPDVVISPDDATTRSKLLVTGHLLEWLWMLPKDLAPPEDVRRKAADYLLSQLPQLTSEDIRNQFCPVTHSILALKH